MVKPTSALRTRTIYWRVDLKNGIVWVPISLKALILVVCVIKNGCIMIAKEGVISLFFLIWTQL